ncbi:MAG: RCC1 domain-containing protein, partial [Planctomycetota bacterium]
MRLRPNTKTCLPIGLFVLIIQCALSPHARAGSVVGWGNMVADSNDFAGVKFVALAAGEDHSLAIKADGSIVGWGYNIYGQATPPSGNDFVAISAGGAHSLALKADGTIAGWGYNFYGQTAPPSGNDFVAVSAGGYHSLALKA